MRNISVAKPDLTHSVNGSILLEKYDLRHAFLWFFNTILHVLFPSYIINNEEICMTYQFSCTHDTFSLILHFQLLLWHGRGVWMENIPVPKDFCLVFAITHFRMLFVPDFLMSNFSLLTSLWCFCSSSVLYCHVMYLPWFCLPHTIIWAHSLSLFPRHSLALYRLMAVVHLKLCPEVLNCSFCEVVHLEGGTKHYVLIVVTGGRKKEWNIFLYI